MTAPADIVFPPPTEAAALYRGRVMHARLRPVVHRFTYDVFSTLLDLDRLPEAGRMSSIFSIGRFNLLSFHEKDHGPRDGTRLRDHADDLLRQAGLDPSGFRILLLCYPRVLGFTFNPLSVYWCYDAGNRLVALIYEVHNTFGEGHAYVAPVADREASAAGVRQARDKLFYVSPFMDMEMRYRFRLQPPAERLALRILETDGSDRPVLAATFSARRAPFSTRALLAAFFAVPLMTLKVVGGIHFEALRLWLKGMRLKPRPAPPAPASFHGPPGATQPLS